LQGGFSNGQWSQKLGLPPPTQQSHNILPGPKVVPALVLELKGNKTIKKREKQNLPHSKAQQRHDAYDDVHAASRRASATDSVRHTGGGT
jgi:hypothetical protein